MRPSTRSALLASVSGIALTVYAPTVFAADPTPPAPMQTAAAATPAPLNKWTWWVEGGAQALSGADSNVFGFTSPFAASHPQWGWDGAIGVDYRIDAAWHLSGDFRYGQTGERSKSSNPVSTFSFFNGLFTSTTAVTGKNSAERKETNWAADFMAGRDLGLGIGDSSQVKLGVRIAQIRGTTNGSASWNAPVWNSPTSTAVITVNHTRSYKQTNKFLGAGPRLALEGNVPLARWWPRAEKWSIDYMGGVAALVGPRSVNQTVSISNSGPAANCLSGCPQNLSNSSTGFVPNPDAMIGVSYALMPGMKLSLNYRVDAYLDALKIVDANNRIKNADRIYSGPNLRLTFNF